MSVCIWLFEKRGNVKEHKMSNNYYPESCQTMSMRKEARSSRARNRLRDQRASSDESQSTRGFQITPIELSVALFRYLRTPIRGLTVYRQTGRADPARSQGIALVLYLFRGRILKRTSEGFQSFKLQTSNFYTDSTGHNS